jgi:hypothetical protein
MARPMSIALLLLGALAGCTEAVAPVPPTPSVGPQAPDERTRFAIPFFEDVAVVTGSTVCEFGAGSRGAPDTAPRGVPPNPQMQPTGRGRPTLPSGATRR